MSEIDRPALVQKVIALKRELAASPYCRETRALLLAALDRLDKCTTPFAESARIRNTRRVRSWGSKDNVAHANRAFSQRRSNGDDDTTNG